MPKRSTIVVDVNKAPIVTAYIIHGSLDVYIMIELDQVAGKNAEHIERNILHRVEEAFAIARTLHVEVVVIQKFFSRH